MLAFLESKGVMYGDNRIYNDALRFKDTVFFKENSDLQDRYEALTKLNSEYPKTTIFRMKCIVLKRA